MLKIVKYHFAGKKILIISSFIALMFLASCSRSVVIVEKDGTTVYTVHYLYAHDSELDWDNIPQPWSDEIWRAHFNKHPFNTCPK